MNHTPQARMDIGQFRELGFLQEVNRQFFHPLGLALEVIIDEKSGVERLGGIWDYRDDPEGLFYPTGVLETDEAVRKAHVVKSLRDMKATIRSEQHGHVVQPIGD